MAWSGRYMYLALKLLALFSIPLPKEGLVHKRLQEQDPAFWRNDTHEQDSFSNSSITAEDQNFLSVPIFHRDDPSSPLNFTRPAGARQRELVVAMLERDAARVRRISARLAIALEAGVTTHGAENQLDPVTADYSQAGFSSPVMSGIPEGSGEFFTTVDVGSPGRAFSLVMDTGSDLTWLQCLPCYSCYDQAGPLFDPALSSSFQPESCPSPACMDDTMECMGDYCVYALSYGDGSFSAGTTVRETFVVGGKAVEGVEMGCGHNNEGLFVGAAGLLGLGRGELSFPSQISSQTDGTFSYCLSPSGPGSLTFGGATVPGDGAPSFTTLLSNPRAGIPFYYVPLTGISIDGSLVSISPADLSLKSSGNGGVIIDSGTTVSRLIQPAYISLRDAFRAAAQTRGYRPAGSYSLFDTCYYASAGMQSTPFPELALHFQEGAMLSLPPPNYLFAVDDETSVLCFAFAPTSGDLSIIGNLQQQRFKVSFDTNSARVGFGSNCVGRI